MVCSSNRENKYTLCMCSCNSQLFTYNNKLFFSSLPLHQAQLCFKWLIIYISKFYFGTDCGWLQNWSKLRAVVKSCGAAVKSVYGCKSIWSDSNARPKLQFNQANTKSGHIFIIIVSFLSWEWWGRYRFTLILQIVFNCVDECISVSRVMKIKIIIIGFLLDMIRRPHKTCWYPGRKDLFDFGQESVFVFWSM